MMELAHYEAALNGNVNEFPFCDISKRDMSDVFNKVSASGNSLLHVAARSGHNEITDLMARHYPFLITKKNIDEDTPLHVATRAGNLKTAIILVARGKQIATTSGPNASLLKMINNLGNTALHEALLPLQALDHNKDEASKKRLESFVALARFLVSADPLVSYCKNNARMSPLCLAVESWNTDILDYLLRALIEGCSVDINLSEGKFPFRIAIEQRNLDLLDSIKVNKPELLKLCDEEGNNLLHYAASEGYLDGVSYLLENNTSDSVLAMNKKGLYPIHLACKNGYYEVMKKLLAKWPHPADLLTNKGRNILHIAAKSGDFNTVLCILGEISTDELVNKMDKDGNTPLHLAALRGYYLVVYALLNHNQSNLELMNNKGVTAYQIAMGQFEKPDMDLPGKSQEQPVADKASLDAFKTMSVMYVVSKIQKKRFNMPIKTRRVRRVFTQEETQNSINSLLVVATLIIGACFAASIQMPSSPQESSGGAAAAGSYRSLVSVFHQNLSSESQAFVFFNSSAMNMSVLAALMLCCAQLMDSYRASIMVSIIYGIAGAAIFMLCQAYEYALKIGTGTYTTYSMPLRVFMAVVSYFQMAFLLPLVFMVIFRFNEFSVLYVIFLQPWLEFRLFRVQFRKI